MKQIAFNKISISDLKDGGHYLVMLRNAKHPTLLCFDGDYLKDCTIRLLPWHSLITDIYDLENPII